jgi:hypothetical protein
MRFRKRIKIAKGISLNFSKSGLSTSFGMKGLSFTVGNKGTYVNYGIPGTGLYDRKKISSNSPDLSKSSNSTNKPISRGSKFQNEASMKLQLKINELGDIQIFDSQGLLIEDQPLLRKIEKIPEYSEKIEVLKNEKITEIQKVNDQFINIYQLTPNLNNEKDWINKYRNLSPVIYVEKKFDVPEPAPVEESISQLQYFTNWIRYSSNSIRIS